MQEGRHTHHDFLPKAINDVKKRPTLFQITEVGYRIGCGFPLCTDKNVFICAYVCGQEKEPREMHTCLQWLCSGHGGHPHHLACMSSKFHTMSIHYSDNRVKRQGNLSIKATTKSGKENEYLFNLQIWKDPRVYREKKITQEKSNLFDYFKK